MSQIFARIVELAGTGDVRISIHAYDRLALNSLSVSEVVASLARGEVLEDYPSYHAGPTILVLQMDREGAPIHTVWGIEKGTNGPAVLVTAYRPDPGLWSADFRSRKP